MVYKRNQSKKLKIAMIGHKQIPSREGGIEIVVGELSTRMVNMGNEVTVYNRKMKHSKNSNIQINKNKDSIYKGVNVIFVHTIDKKGLAALSSSFCATIRAIFGHYDCIHYHAEGPSVMLIIPHIFGIRTVVTIHGLDWKRAKWKGIAVKYLKFGEKIAAKYADEVIVLSKNMQDYFMKNYGRKTSFITNGVEKQKVKKAEIITEKWALKKDNYVLFLGRMVPEKGIKYLIDAFKQVDTDKKLVIAGGASDTDDFVKEIKEFAKDDDRIIFTGFVKGDVLQELYSNSYIYCLPSDVEGMPISLLEAMSYNNCCLVSDIPECAEVVEDKAITFKKSNVKDLKNKLQQLCDNKELVEKYKNDASEFVCTKYDWNEVVKQTILLYK